MRLSVDAKGLAFRKLRSGRSGGRFVQAALFRCNAVAVFHGFCSEIVSRTSVCQLLLLEREELLFYMCISGPWRVRLRSRLLVRSSQTAGA